MEELLEYQMHHDRIFFFLCYALCSNIKAMESEHSYSSYCDGAEALTSSWASLAIQACGLQVTASFLGKYRNKYLLYFCSIHFFTFLKVVL